MTDPERLQCELTHLLNLCRPPLTAYWEPVATRKAVILANWDKAYAELPALLAKGLTGMKEQSQPPTACSAQSEPRSGSGSRSGPSSAGLTSLKQSTSTAASTAEPEKSDG